MHFLSPSEITVRPERQRKVHDINKHQELVESIATTGLLHPPVIRQEGAEWVLVAGERRLRAMIDLIDFARPFKVAGDFDFNGGAIPCLSIGELDVIAAEEAELDENIKRVDLSMQERAAATARLMLLRKKQAAVNGAPEPTAASIALELERTQPSVRDDLIIARHLDDPVVAKAKTAGEALKHLKRVEQRQKMELKTSQVLASPVTLHSQHRLILGEALEELANLPSGHFQVILSDPPYGMGADEFGDGGGAAVSSHRYDDSLESWIKLLEGLAPELFRVAATDAAVYLFCDIDRFQYLKNELESVGFRVHRTPLLWLRPQGARVPWPDAGHRRAWEMCLFAIKGERKINHLKNDWVLCAPDENLGHSAQKPVALMEDLLARSAQPGDHVLDPFMGTAAVLPAAHKLLCRYTGIEMESASFGIASTRLEKLK